LKLKSFFHRKAADRGVRVRIWNSHEAYPGEALLQNYKDQDLLTELREAIRQTLFKQEKLLVEFQQQPEGRSLHLKELELDMFTGTAQVIYD
jgi:hypothetical protein